MAISVTGAVREPNVRVHLLRTNGELPLSELLMRALCLEALAIHQTCIMSVFCLHVCQPFPMCELIRKSGQWNPGSRVMAQGVNAVVSEVPMPQFNR